MTARRPPFLGVRFEVVDRFRPVDLVADGLADLRQEPVSTSGLVLSSTGPRAPYAAVVLRDLAAGTPAEAGLATPDGDHALLRWTPRRARLSLEVRRDGRTSVLARTRRSPGRDAGLALVLTERQLTAFAGSADRWRPVLTARVGEVDLRREAVLAGYRYAWSGEAGSVEAGPFGGIGMRDPHLVQHADGSAVQQDGRVLMTWSSAGPGFFQHGHWGVWSVDPADPRDLRRTALIYGRRDGLVLGDHAGHLVRHQGRWLVAVSAWGDFRPGSVHVRHAAADADLLSGVHVLDTEPVLLPTTMGAWDPSLTRVAGRWVVGFVESPSQRPFRFHPAIAATGAAEWTDGLGLVAADLRRTQCEGTTLVTSGGSTWLVASDRASRSYPVLDLDGRHLGALDAPYLTNLPHPALLPDPAGGWWLLTFDGTPYHRSLRYGSHGDVVVLHSR